MSLARVFVPQEALESWVAEGRAQLNGETLVLEEVPFQLASAVRFIAEVAGGGDAQELVGKVKTLVQVSDLGGEHVTASVVLGDNAYEVIDGFLAQPADGVEKLTHDRVLKLFPKS
ncbi:MAG: hypothetical protein QM778_32450 [Myxococcales bacterium]